MVRIQSNFLLNSEEELKLSVLATVARLQTRRPLFKFLARFQRSGIFNFHLKNVLSVKQLAFSLGSDSLQDFAEECEELIKSKVQA